MPNDHCDCRCCCCDQPVNEIAEAAARSGRAEFALEVLNAIHRADPRATQAIMGFRFVVNAAFAGYPLIASTVEQNPDGDSVNCVNVLALINAALGPDITDAGPVGPIAMRVRHDKDKHVLLGFERYEA